MSLDREIRRALRLVEDIDANGVKHGGEHYPNVECVLEIGESLKAAALKKAASPRQRAVLALANALISIWSKGWSRIPNPLGDYVSQEELKRLAAAAKLIPERDAPRPLAGILVSREEMESLMSRAAQRFSKGMKFDETPEQFAKAVADEAVSMFIAAYGGAVVCADGSIYGKTT
jgi:hypothetical protein